MSREPDVKLTNLDCAMWMTAILKESRGLYIVTEFGPEIQRICYSNVIQLWHIQMYVEHTCVVTCTNSVQL